jgi:hypothetical protein
MIEGGRIVVTRAGPALKFTHYGEDGQPRRSLSKAGFMNGQAWSRAMEDWLTNYHEDMPLVKPCGALTTVGAYEEDRRS